MEFVTSTQKINRTAASKVKSADEYAPIIEWLKGLPILTDEQVQVDADGNTMTSGTLIVNNPSENLRGMSRRITAAAERIEGFRIADKWSTPDGPKSKSGKIHIQRIADATPEETKE